MQCFLGKYLIAVINSKWNTQKKNSLNVISNVQKAFFSSGGTEFFLSAFFPLKMKNSIAFAVLNFIIESPK